MVPLWNSSQAQGLLCAGKTVSPLYCNNHSTADSFQRFSVLPVLSLDGIIHCNILEGSFHTGTFYQFIKGLLASMQPFLGPNSVIIMDNCCIHKNLEIQRLIQQWYVPPAPSHHMPKFTNVSPVACIASSCPLTLLI